MDAQRFAAVVRSLAETPARRRVLHLLAGSTLGLLAGETWPAAARKKRGKGKKGSSPGGRRCPQPPCAPDCKGKVCGDDGCGGDCGTCGGGTRRDGICDCTNGNKELCGGVCRAACPPGRLRNPLTCGCCIANGEPSGSALCSLPGGNECCSQICDPSGTNDCLGSNGTCQFDAQCASSVCLSNGTCQP